MLDETDKRIEVVKSGAEGIDVTEAKLSKLSEDIATRMRLLEELVRNDIDKNPAPHKEGITPQLRLKVRALKKQGWKDDEIAASLKRSLGEVQLILQMMPETEL